MHKNSTKTELAQYLHGCCFSPTKSTFINAIKNGNFSTWPGLTENLISKMPPSPNTAKGHLNQEMANLQSTKIKEDKDFFPDPESPNMKTNLFMASLEKFSATNKAYTDLTGRFPVQSSRGNNYILICYSYDGNTILAEPLKNRSAPEMIRAWNKVNDTLASAGIEPKIYILDNEISREYKQTLQ